MLLCPWVKYLTAPMVYECVCLFSDEQVSIQCGGSCYQCINLCEWVNATCSVNMLLMVKKTRKRLYKYNLVTIYHLILTTKQLMRDYEALVEADLNTQFFLLIKDIAYTLIVSNRAFKSPYFLSSHRCFKKNSCELC